MFTFLLTVLILDAIVLSVVVLLQAGQGGGLASLGGAGGTDTVLGGRQAVTILTKATWWCGGIFLVLSLVLSLVPRGTGSSDLQQRLRATTPAPSAPLPLGGSTTTVAPPAGTQGAGHAVPGAARPQGRSETPPRPGNHDVRGWRGDRMTDRPAFVLLEDGAWFAGTTTRALDPAFGEVVFTTNLTGYQETFTDPSYLGQIVVMTAPMIGNYGVNLDDMESSRPQVTGVVIRELSRHTSNWRATRSLDEWLAEAGVPVLEGIDTRRMTRHLRERGAMRGVMAEGREPSAELTSRLLASPSMEGLDLATRATVGERWTRRRRPARDRVRLWHQAKHRSQAGGRRLQGDRGSGGDERGPGPGAKS